MCTTRFILFLSSLVGGTRKNVSSITVIIIIVEVVWRMGVKWLGSNCLCLFCQCPFDLKPTHLLMAGHSENGVINHIKESRSPLSRNRIPGPGALREEPYRPSWSLGPNSTQSLYLF